MSIVANDERKIVSVLFCDIAGSYTFLYENDPEQGKLVLDDAIATMTAVIERFGGVVNQVQGDGVMSLYGAPQAMEDQASKACDAASELVKTFRNKNTEGLWPNGVSIEIRVGISTGEAVVGVQATKFPSSSENYEYYATGAVSHLAGRLQKLAQAFEIVISESTVELLGSAATTRALSDRSVHELIKAHSKPYLLESLNQTDMFALSPSKLAFVGRDSELNFLSQAMSNCLKNCKPWGVLVSGDAGMGKSRLVQEFLGTRQKKQWDVIAITSLEIESNSPFAVLRRLLNSWLLGDGDDSSTPTKLTEQLISACNKIDADDWVLPLALSDVLGLDLTDSRWEKFEPDIKRSQIDKSVVRLMVQWGETNSIVCVIEDLHWADNVSMRILESALTNIESGSIMFLFTSRSHNTFADISNLQKVPLGSLTAEASRTLLASLPTREPIPESEVSGLLARCGGVPLFIEQIAYSDVSPNGISNAVGHSTGFHFSSQVRSLIQARLDKLPTDAKRVLSVASVAGTQFSFNSIVAVHDTDRPLTQALIEVLIARGLIEPTRIAEEYTFSHALFQEVAYLGILKSRLDNYHRQYLNYFKKRQALAPSNRRFEKIEHHAFRGKQWADVIHYGNLAAQEALDRGAYREAMHYLEGAIQAFAKITEYSHEDKQIYMRKHAICLIDLSRAAIPLGEVAHAYDALEECQAICENLQDDHILCESLAYRTALYAFQEDSKAAIECGEHAVQVAQATASERLIYGCKVYLAQALFFSGDFTATVKLLQPLVDQGVVDRFPFDRIGNTGPASIDCYGILSMAYAQLGRFDTAESYGHLAKDVADKTGKSFDQGLAYYYLTYTMCHRIKMEEALSHLQKLTELFDAGGVQFLRPWVIGLLGFIYVKQDRYSEAGDLIVQSMSDARSMSLRIFECYGLLTMVLLQTRLGNYKAAQSALSSADRLATEAQYSSISMWVTRSKGVLAMAQGQFEDAQMYLRTARDHAQSLGMLPDVAHCHGMSATVYASIASSKKNPKDIELANERSNKHREIADRMYAEMGMDIVISDQ